MSLAGNDRLFVVSGPPRSGTSLMMQMLVAAGLRPFTDGKRIGDANNPQGYFEHQSIQSLARDARVLLEARGQVVKVIHVLLRHVPAELPMLVFFMHRDLVEVLRSQDAMLERLHRPARTLPDDTMLSTLSRQVRSARSALDHRPDTHVIDVEHRALVTQPDAATRLLAQRVAGVTGWKPDAATMARCLDPRLYRERGPA